MTDLSQTPTPCHRDACHRDACHRDAGQLVADLLGLWAEPIDDPSRALEAFATLYTNPLTLNGVELALSQLVDRASATHAALRRTGVEVLDVVGAPGKVVVVFEMTARHVGPQPSALGEVAATGRTVSVRTIDVLTTTDGLVSGIWVVSDEAGLLAQVGARLQPGGRTTA